MLTKWRQKTLILLIVISTAFAFSPPPASRRRRQSLTMSSLASSPKKIWSIRQSTLDDEAAIQALLKASYETLLATHYPQTILKEALPFITKARPELLESGTYYVVENESNGEILGCGGWTPTSPMQEESSQQQYPNLRHFGTSPTALRQGIARALWERCWSDVSKRLGEDTEMEVYATLNGADFYAALGFQALHKVDIPLPLPDGLKFGAMKMIRTPK